MAAHVVAPTEKGAYEKTLTASTVDTVTFTDRRASPLEVINEGATGLYVRTDGTNPTVGDADAIYVPPSTTRVVPNPEGGSPTVARVISAGASKYSVAVEV